MDWKSKNLELGRIALVVWFLVISLKKSFGNKTMSTFHTRSLDSLLIQSTTSSFSSSTVLDGLNSSSASALPTLLNASTLQTLSKALTLANAPTASASSSASTYTLSKVSTFSTASTLSKVSTSSSASTFIHTLSKTSTFSTASALSKVSTASVLPSSTVLPNSTTLLNPITLLNSSTLNTSVLPQKASSKFIKLSSSESVFEGPNKTFVAEIRININFTSELENRTSSLYYTTALIVTKAIDVIMISETHYLGCEIMSFRDGSVIANFEIKMGSGSSNDPKVALDRLKVAVESGRVGNLTVDSTYFVRWLKKNPSPREKLLSGQLAGVAIIFFILVVLLLVICLGNFADEPLFKETELFSAEMTTRNVEREGGNHDNGNNLNDDWKFDPLFAWSHPSSCDSKL